jgi:hypothetical protein
MLSARIGKEPDKTGYDFHSGCLRNQSLYSVIARSVVCSVQFMVAQLQLIDRINVL